MPGGTYLGCTCTDAYLWNLVAWTRGAKGVTHYRSTKCVSKTLKQAGTYLSTLACSRKKVTALTLDV